MHEGKHPKFSWPLFLVPCATFGLMYKLPKSNTNTNVYESRTYFLFSNSVTALLATYLMIHTPEPRFHYKVSAMFLLKYLYYLTVTKNHPARVVVFPLYIGISFATFLHILVSPNIDNRKVWAAFMMNGAVLDTLYYLKMN